MTIIAAAGADTAEGAMFGRISAGGSAATEFVKLASRISAAAPDIQAGAPSGLDHALSSMLSAGNGRQKKGPRLHGARVCII